MVHGHALDGRGPMEPGIESGHLVHGREQEGVGFLKCREAIDDLTVPYHGCRHLCRGEAGAMFDFANRLGLELGSMRGQQRREIGPRAERAQRQEHLIGIREIRMRLLDDAAQVLEDMALGFQHGAHATIQRQTA